MRSTIPSRNNSNTIQAAAEVTSNHSIPSRASKAIVPQVIPSKMCPIMSADSSGSASSWASATSASSLQPRSGAGDGEVLVNLLPGGGSGGAARDDYVYYALQPRPGAGHDEVFIGPLPDGAGRGEVFIGPLLDGVGAVFDSSGNFARLTLPAPGTGRADGIAGALRDLKLGAGAGYDGSVALVDDLGAAYNNLRRLLPFAGIGACSVAVNGLGAGPCSPAVAFHLFMLLLAGLFLVILHVLRV